jgi:histidinol-phosphatase
VPPSTPPSQLSADLALALELADVADGITMPRFRAVDLRVTTKPDLTPVSEADVAVEQALRGRLAEARPDHGFVGEEYGAEGDTKWRWIVDPIDGTKNYVRGVPVWATLIALQHGDDVVAGVVSAPALGRRWWAARGGGAFADGVPIRVSAVSTLADAFVSFAGYGTFRTGGRGAQLDTLLERSWRVRAFGDFWQHMLVAEGAADVALDPEVSLWDLAALQVIVEEAGGRFSDLAGRATPDGGSGVSTNGRLHDDVLAIFAAR